MTATPTTRAAHVIETSNTHPSSPPPDGHRALASVALLYRLQVLADAVERHKHDPGFPELFAHHDIQAMHDRLARAVVQAASDRGELQSLLLSSRAFLSGARELYERGVLGVKSFLGASSPLLPGFGLKPRRAKKGGR
jgi:hypothetical protein